ncbi:ABC transport system permease protein [[Clostridium] ultunense Esp]|uniref:ABC transport system permease protein n=1 Tax=[Clostridium] ultunense Esp TaxID=1288971 RepID=M1ZE64_9FIRM|nr:FtsX-like permease family protein [Schnuerera ultunensis]CCQ96228.1 ABC transport system permease protein [[Clostridium] ultunense Esp]SHD78163.1 ABC transport system permease protein [[Clostridium] ultunense Esp]
MIANNNRKIIGKLASRSVKFHKTRNIFVLITIVLSVSLLGVISLSQSAREQKIKKQLGMVQHVIYENANKEQVDELKAIDEIDFLTLAKHGSSFKLENKLIRPVYFEKDTKSIKKKAIAEGNYPEKLNEIVIDRPMLKLFPDAKNIGDSIDIKFLDGREEKFVISGFYEEENENASIYTILFSKEYSEYGEQLKDVPYAVLCKIENADTMSEEQFLNTINKIGEDAGIERKNINPNNFFTNSLSLSKQNILAIILVSIGILFVSILVVYSIFYISVLENIQRFGQLRTIGTSKKQIKAIVRREGTIMFSLGTPIGLLISWIIAYWIFPEGWNWKYTIILSLIIAIAEFITIIISVQKPAKVASSISPVEASRFSPFEGKGLKETKELHRKLSPFSMARVSIVRNRKKSFLTLVSLGIGGALFIMSTTMIVSTSLEEYSRQGLYRHGEYIISFDYNAVQTMENGLTEIQIKNPINEELIKKIKSIPYVDEIVKSQRASIKYDYKDAVNNEDYISPFTREDIDIINRTLVDGTFDYDKMMKNDEILITQNDVVQEIYGWKFDIGDKVNFRYFDGEKEVQRSFKVIGSIDERKFTDNYNMFLVPIEKLERLFPGINTIDALVISINDFEKSGDEVEESLRNLIEDNPLLGMDTLRERLAEDKGNFDRINKVIIGLSSFIILFSLINLVNTIITNIISRKKEFAMLQSVGLSKKQLVRMIQFEGLSLSFGNLIITLTFGTVLGYGLIRVLQYFGANYMHYRFPIGYFLMYIIIIIMVPMVVSGILVRLFQKESLVSRLRYGE